MQSYKVRYIYFFWSSWIRKKLECRRTLAGLVWWEIKNVLHVRLRTCKYAISGLKIVRFDFFWCCCCHPCLHNFRFLFQVSFQFSSQVSNIKSYWLPTLWLRLWSSSLASISPIIVPTCRNCQNGNCTVGRTLWVCRSIWMITVGIKRKELLWE